MKEIRLTQGKIAIVDDEDFELVSQYRWHAVKSRNTFYAATKCPLPTGPKMHALLMGKQPGYQIDHIDGNGLNNQRHNLRFVTAAQNAANTNPYRTNTSGYKGVMWRKYLNKWEVRIKVNGKRISLGYYTDKEAAARAYDAAAKEHFGDFARVNLKG